MSVFRIVLQRCLTQFFRIFVSSKNREVLTRVRGIQILELNKAQKVLLSSVRAPWLGSRCSLPLFRGTARQPFFLFHMQLWVSDKNIGILTMSIFPIQTWGFWHVQLRCFWISILTRGASCIGDTPPWGSVMISCNRLIIYRHGLYAYTLIHM
jgi:hypothetical protein